MKIAVVVLITLHALIHLMGTAKAFRLAELPQLSEPISRTMGMVWLVAAVALLTTAVLVALSFRSWWMVGLLAVALSQAAVFTAWGDAKFGTLVNVLLLGVVVYGFMSQGPLSFAGEYRREVDRRLADAPSRAAVLTDDDLTHLPPPVQRYLRLTGVVGRPRAHHVRAAWRGRIRAGPDEPWMPFTAEQYNFVHEPARFFRMDARRAGLPVDVLHAFRDGTASMRVRLLSMIPVADARGPLMTRAETVTLLNDMALFVPSALADPELRDNLRWAAVDARTARVSYTVGPNEVGAVMTFNEEGELVDFVSDDRFAITPGDGDFVQWRWSTPVRDYRRFGAFRLMSRGEALWHAPEGPYAYIELELLELEVNGGG
ncbi:MAG: hypothetical protein P8188_18755 [Gemmatimonadota bacterium]